jgi:hypothetical protein
LVPGVGNLEPNEQDGNEDEEPEEAKDMTWRKLLDKEGMLKPWAQVKVKATKVNIGIAMREYMRQAWSKVFFLLLFLPSNSNMISSFRQRGENHLGEACQRQSFFDPPQVSSGIQA